MDKYNTGQYQDIDARLDDHNNGRSGFTISSNDWEVEWKKIFETRSQAILEERRISNINISLLCVQARLGHAEVRYNIEVISNAPAPISK